MRLLSYPIDERTPVYGGASPPRIKTDKSQKGGDSSNSLWIELSNHTGTHIDCPYHFDLSGKKLTDYSADFWFCSSVILLIFPQRPAPEKLIDPDDISVLSSSAAGATGGKKEAAEALILKTGYSHIRNTEAYFLNPPGIHPELGPYLRETYPALKFFGFDLISVSSYARRPEGRLAHRALLCSKDPILPIEDMDLRTVPQSGIQNLLVSPLILESADGAPCTIWADIPSNP